MKRNLFSCSSAAKLALILFSVTLVADAQKSAAEYPTTDKAKIADALRAAPTFITNNATILD